MPPPVRSIFVFLYKIYSVLIGIDIPWQTKIGEGLRISHPNGIVISDKAILGKNVWLRANTVVGIDLISNKAPVIGDNVNIGVNAIIIGNIQVGDNCVIGAGAVVTKSIPPNSVVAGNPARVIRLIDDKGERCNP